MSKQASISSRRTFLKASAGAGLAVALSQTQTRAAGANDRLGVGFIGVGGRGSGHVALCKALADGGENLALVAVCDAYGPRLRAHAEKYKMKPYRKHSELLADKDVDIVLVATPDRTHLPVAIDAIRAGKDVYCEKPMGHWTQFALSGQFFQETRKLNRVVQVGNQGNSCPAWQKLAEVIKAGKIGKPQLVNIGFYRRGDWGERMPIADPNAKPGPDLDWEAFLGDAPKVPFTVDRFFSWRKYLDYAGGPCTDLFPHAYTPFVSAMGLGIPQYTVATGGIYEYTTYDREVPDTFSMSMDYDKPTPCTVNIASTLANDFMLPPAIYGDEGTITLKNVGEWNAGMEGIHITPFKGEKEFIPSTRGDSTREHWINFLKCVRGRERPVADVEFGYRVQGALCGAMLAWKERKVARYDEEKKELVLG
jgi:predicted dehydrogenase